MKLVKLPKRIIFMVWGMINQLTRWVLDWEWWSIRIVRRKEVLISMNISEIIFVYDTRADICLLREGKSIRELIIKGSCEYQGIVNGTWFQIDHLTKHWISFRWNRFKANTWQAFYKCIGNEQITYYRRMFYKVEGIIAFSFSEKDEWIKDEMSGRWRSKQANKFSPSFFL